MKSITLAILIVTSSLALTKNAPSKSVSLSETYQKELAFLLAQKRTLLKQIKSIRGEFDGKIKKATRKVKSYEDTLIALSSENEMAVNKLADLERNLENSVANKDLVNTTLSQAKVTLALNTDAFKGHKNTEESINFIFAGALKHLNEGSKIHTAQGEFFLENGKKVAGNITSFGHIAKFGTYEKKMGMLMPVGGRKFRFMNENLMDAGSFSMKKYPNILNTFLFESQDKAIEEKKEQTFMEMVDAGGMIAYVIVFLGLFAFILMLYRGYLLWTTGKVDQSLIKDLENGNIDNLETRLKDLNSSFSRVLRKTFNALDLDTDKREHVISESILGELNFLDRFGAVILVMAAVAPLLGLLGTVTGMISTFDIITEFGTGDPKLLSSGISEALITTKLGLIVAIPTLLVGNLFGGWSSKIKVMLEREALRLSNIASQNNKVNANA